MYPMLKRLNDEWSTLVANTSTTQIQAWPQWPTVAQHSPTATLNDVLIWITQEPDPALHFLVHQAQEGDTLAARTVLQTMLGKLVLVSVQSARPGLSQEAAFTDLTCQMWVTVVNYPLAARPRKIAANLWMDCAKEARRMWFSGRPDQAPEISYSPDEASWLLDHSITASSADARWSDIRGNDLIDAALHLELIGADTADLLKAVYGPHGLSGKHAAQLWGITPAAIRTRCKRAVQILTDSADQLLAA